MIDGILIVWFAEAAPAGVFVARDPRRGLKHAMLIRPDAMPAEAVRERATRPMPPPPASASLMGEP